MHVWISNPAHTSTGIFCVRYGLEYLLYCLADTTLNLHTTAIPKAANLPFYMGAL